MLININEGFKIPHLFYNKKFFIRTIYYKAWNSYMNYNLLNNPTVQKHLRMRDKREEALRKWNERNTQSVIQEEKKPITESTNPKINVKLQKQQEINKKMARRNYLTEESINALTTVLSILVESSLLVDMDDFEKVNPTIHEDIKQSVRTFVDKAGLKTDLKNPNTATLINMIAETVNSDTNLRSEEIERQILKKINDENVAKALDELQYDIVDKVSQIIQSDVDRIKEIRSEIDKVTENTFNSEVELDEYENDLYDVGYEEYDETEDIQEAATRLEKENYTFSTVGGLRFDKVNNPNNQTTTLKSKVLKEYYCNGLLEALAVKEGMLLIESGQEYSADVALGKAITYLTILETFNATNLIEMTPKDYDNLKTLAGAGSNSFKSARINEDVTEIAYIAKPNGEFDNIKDKKQYDSIEIIDDKNEFDISTLGEDCGDGRISYNEDEMRRIIIEKFGGIPENKSFLETVVSGGYMKLNNGRYVKI